METDRIRDEISKLTPEQQNIIKQVEVNMALSDMPLDEQSLQNMVDIVTGKKTSEEVIEEITKKYMHDELADTK